MHGPSPGSLTWPEKVANNLGLTLTECAAWLGVDRRALGRLVEEVPFGLPAATVSPGRIPARRVGRRWIVIPADLLGAAASLPPPTPVGDLDHQAASPRAAIPPAAPDSFLGELAVLRRAGRRAVPLDDDCPAATLDPEHPSSRPME